MDFVLRIFFSGLIAFLPSADGKELMVLLVNTPHEYALADGSALPHHMPMLLARAASCEGTCTTDDSAGIAQFLFANKSQQEALTAMNGALSGGGAWLLSSSDLSLVGPQEPLAIRTDARGSNNDGTLHVVPTTPLEREDFSWVTSLGGVVPGMNGFKAAVSSSDEAPPPCMIVARLKLRSGKVFTYSLVKVDGTARPIHFRKPTGDGPESPYAQAAANWVEAEIHVPGDTVEIDDQNFSDPAHRRVMKLHPQNGVVEVAVLNLPPFVAPSPDAPQAPAQPGQHYQLFYDLVKTPPARADRLVPYPVSSPSEPQVDWGALHPRAALWSDLLEQLGIAPRGKAPYDVSLCPMTQR
jgi:hypothetical protein